SMVTMATPTPVPRQNSPLPAKTPTSPGAAGVLGERLPWVAVHGISTHWLRHTTLTWVERHFGYGIARAYAGHTDSPGSSTITYIKADLHDVAEALSAMAGQPHPMAARIDDLQSKAKPLPTDLSQPSS
ncbi:hypothetical protein ACGFIW_19615, partial [Micromonospora sp. NPDC048935]